MKLMKKIALVFIAVTAISSIAYFAIGRSIVNQASAGELERGPGRTGGMLNKIEGEMNKVTSQAMEFGEYFSILDKVTDKYGNEKIKDIIDIDKMVNKSPVANMILVDENFQIYKEVKISNIDTTSKDIIDLLRQSKEVMNKEENSKKGFFGGLISTNEMVYAVGAQKIQTGKSNRLLYNLTIRPLDREYISNLGINSDRDISIVKNIEDQKASKEVVIRTLGDKDYYCIRNKNSIDVYTDLETLGDGPKYVFHLKDDTDVRTSALQTINVLVFVATIVTAIANIISYEFIKSKVLERIIGINNIVNDVTNGSDLEVHLDEDNESDEISTLTEDLNHMFARLKTNSDNLEYMGSHDVLTGLMNRQSILDHILSLSSKKKEFSVFFIDLDNFKSINDTLGHNIGDRLLCKAAEKLSTYEKDNIKVSRFGGDEFIIVRKGNNKLEEINRIAEDILESLNSNFEIYNYIYEIKASIGISFYPQHSVDEITLVQYSDIAMYNSKANGGNVYSIFNEYMLEPLQIEGKIKNSIENGEFEVYYQPIYGISKGEIIGAEALIRWNSDDEIIYPDKFIPVSKKTGDIVDIDMFVLRQAIGTCRDWINKGEENFYISINASNRFLKQKDLLSIIKYELDRKNVPSSFIKLEITEDEIIDDVKYTTKLLNEIREMGIQVYLDDFGTGYSSFNHIKELPIDVIKIDRSFLVDIHENEKSRSIVETIINLCHSLNLNIVCEGVEGVNQVEILKELNCDCIQGYYFSKPLPKGEFNKFVELYNK